MTNSTAVASIKQSNNATEVQGAAPAPAPALVYVHYDEDLHTIIAALRFWQRSGMGEPCNRDDEMHELATNGGEVTSLCYEDIDKLVMAINIDHDPVAFRAQLDALKN